MSAARVGQQTGIPATAFVNQTLCRWNLSRLGVLTFGSPAKPKACSRHWSGRMNRTFGRAAGSAKIVGWTPTIIKLRLSRSEEHTSELQSHSFISYAVFCLKKKTNNLVHLLEANLHPLQGSCALSRKC